MLFGYDLSIIALIGIVLLIGIVKKNAIMMIDFALEAERDRGKGPVEAIHEACLLRFRPIMMTTFAALGGGLPLALGTGAAGTAPAARHRHRRRLAGVAMAHPLHHAGRLSLPRPAVAAPAQPAPRPHRRRRMKRGRPSRRTPRHGTILTVAMTLLAPPVLPENRLH